MKSKPRARDHQRRADPFKVAQGGVAVGSARLLDRKGATEDFEVPVYEFFHGGFQVNELAADPVLVDPRDLDLDQGQAPFAWKSERQSYRLAFIEIGGAVHLDVKPFKAKVQNVGLDLKPDDADRQLELDAGLSAEILIDWKVVSLDFDHSALSLFE